MLRINILSGILFCMTLSGCVVVTVATTAASVGATAVGLGIDAGTAAVKVTSAGVKGVAKATGLTKDEEKAD